MLSVDKHPDAEEKLVGLLRQAIADGQDKARHWCDLCEWLEVLDPETREEALMMLRSKEWTAKLVAEAFNDAGFAGGGDTVYNHRRAMNNG